MAAFADAFRAMVPFYWLCLLKTARLSFRPQRELALENLALGVPPQNLVERAIVDVSELGV
jgi:hypothetical protein